MRRNRRYLITFGIVIIIVAIASKMFLNAIYRLPILMYHSIDYTSDKKNKITVSPLAFERQMRFLRDNGYNVITLEKAVWYIETRKRPPAKTIAITMDDGYENNYKYAYPILRKYKIPVTTFIITGLVGKDDFLDWSQIREMSDSRLIDIESHTVNHKWLTGLDDEALRRELENSKKVLEDHLGKEVNYLCYPMGGFDERVKVAAKKANYKAAFATKPTMLRPNYDIFEIKRVRISPSANNPLVFYIKTSGYHAFFRIIQNDYKDIPYLSWEKRSS